MPRKNLEELAYESIIRLIQDGHFKPGDVLIETELSDLLNIKSRTPIRHALGQLVAKGFLEKRKKKGCFIPLASGEDAKHVFFAREVVEGNAAFSAALHADAQDLEELHQILDLESEEGKAGNKFGYSSLNEAFHGIIARASKNVYLQRYSEHLVWRSSIYVFFFDAYYTQQDFVNHMHSPEQHQNIVRAIEERDAEKARELMGNHVRFIFDKLFKFIG